MSNFVSHNLLLPKYVKTQYPLGHITLTNIEVVDNNDLFIRFSPLYEILHIIYNYNIQGGSVKVLQS